MRDFLGTLWSTKGRHTLTLLTIAIIVVICATVGAQVALNAWNRPFYNAIQARDFPAFAYQSLVFVMIAGTLLVLNVAQAWLREMIKLRSREWLTRDLVAQWLVPGRAMRLAYAGEIGVNPDQRIQQDTSQLTDLAAELGVGLLQASLLLVTFLGVLWQLSGAITVPIGGISVTIPGYMVWCAILFAAAGSWLAWRVGGPLVGLNARRFQRESALRFALVQVNQQADDIAQHHREESEKQRLGVELDSVLAVMREIVGAIARVTWVTAGYGWVSLIAPLVIAAPAYFSGRLSFGELMMVVGGFLQVNQSLRWFVDNFSRIAEWGATLLRVMSFRDALVTFESRLGGGDRIDHAKDSPGRLRLEGVGVAKPDGTAALDQHEIDVAPGDRIHIVDRTPVGRNPLLAALAGLWPWGSGKVRTPGDMKMMFLKRRPYFPPGSLRAALAFPDEPSTIADSNVTAALDRVELGYLASALDRQTQWGLALTEDEQIRVGIARLLLHRPSWIFAENVLDALTEEHRDLIRSIFAAELAKSAVISIGRQTPAKDLCPKVIRLTSGPPAPDRP
ncbi:MAG TPA: ABC transporter ATP-binding protein/permease [Pseudolabrys sp.]|nr:ABC transporter ATP-binding protein/permease [Pseudolabrys sp.]